MTTFDLGPRFRDLQQLTHVLEEMFPGDRVARLSVPTVLDILDGAGAYGDGWRPPEGVPVLPVERRVVLLEAVRPALEERSVDRGLLQVAMQKRRTRAGAGVHEVAAAFARTVVLADWRVDVRAAGSWVDAFAQRVSGEAAEAHAVLEAHRKRRIFGSCR